MRVPGAGRSEVQSGQGHAADDHGGGPGIEDAGGARSGRCFGKREGETPAGGEMGLKERASCVIEDVDGRPRAGVHLQEVGKAVR